MSTTPDIETRLRNLRRRIIQEMVKIPYYVASNISPDAIALGEVYGRRMFNVPTRAVNTVIADKNTGEVLRAPQIQLWFTEAYTYQDIQELLADVVDVSRDAVFPYKAEILSDTTGAVLTTYKRVAKLKDVYCAEFTVQDATQLITLMNPREYPVSFPLKVYVAGRRFYDKVEENYEFMIIVGRVGYRDSNNRWVFWDGLAMYLSAQKLVRLKTAHGEFGYVDGKWVNLLATSSVFVALAEAATWSPCGGT